ncbi:hypothetical protein BV22DRAFT_1135904, partial [Leucogyrophana mollusca]
MSDEEALSHWEDLHNHVVTQTAQTFVTSFLIRCVRANTEHVSQTILSSVAPLDTARLLPRYKHSSKLETYLQTVEGVTHSFLAAAPYRMPGQETEGFVIFYSPSFDLDGEDASNKLLATHTALKDISVKMITLPPQLIVPIPVNQMEKTTLEKLSRARLLTLFKQGGLAKHIARAEELIGEARGATFVAPSTNSEKALASIYAGIFNLDEGEVSASDNFFELGGTSIDVI